MGPCAEAKGRRREREKAAGHGRRRCGLGGSRRASAGEVVGRDAVGEWGVGKALARCTRRRPPTRRGEGGLASCLPAWLVGVGVGARTTDETETGRNEGTRINDEGRDATAPRCLQCTRNHPLFNRRGLTAKPSNSDPCTCRPIRLVSLLLLPLVLHCASVRKFDLERGLRGATTSPALTSDRTTDVPSSVHLVSFYRNMTEASQANVPNGGRRRRRDVSPTTPQIRATRGPYRRRPSLGGGRGLRRTSHCEADTIGRGLCYRLAVQSGETSRPFCTLTAPRQPSLSLPRRSARTSSVRSARRG